MSLKVYYLDDEVDLLTIFSETFSSEQISVRTFSDPESLVQTVKADPPQLLFLDYRLPNTTGIEVASRLDPAIPKVLITGDMSLEQKGPFVATIEKPTDPNMIEQLLQKYLVKA